jgi:hypothetical protein
MEERAATPPYADALLMWTNTAALIIVGIVCFDDAIAIGRIILPLALLSAVNLGLKLRATRTAQPGYQTARIVVALVYVAVTLLSLVALSLFKLLPWHPLG